MRLAIGHSWPNNIPIRCLTAPFLAHRVEVGRKWAEYQGCNNWEGLLNPLHPTLRAEILRYGNFVQSAYSAFDFDPSSLGFATCRYPKHELLSLSGLPDSGYITTKNLQANSGIDLPGWVDRASGWFTKQSSWIGYVAVCEDKKMISQLGRRDVVIALRGTVTCMEWLENMRTLLTHLPGCPSSECRPMVESGFWSLFTSKTATCRSLCDSVREEVARVLDSYRGEPISVTVTGHSLGAALAVLTGHDITTTFGDRAPMVTVFSFGGPRVGNLSFKRHVESNGLKVLRIVNSQDMITKLPGFFVSDDNEDDGSEFRDDIQMIKNQQLPADLIRKMLDTCWAYSDVGRELRLTADGSPFLGRDASNVATCHELDVYLHLVSQHLRSPAVPEMEKVRVA